jgi:hypothetical protein
MKRQLLGLLLALALLAALVFAAAPALAEPDIEFESTSTYCSLGTPERAWFADNTIHGRNEQYLAVMESVDPRFQATVEIWGNWNINLDTMKGRTWGEFDKTVSGLDGGWKGSWQGEMYMPLPPVIMANGNPLWLNNHRGNGHGYGSLKGLQEHYQAEVYVTVYDELPQDVPCVTGMTIDGKYFVLQQHTQGFISGK